MFPLGISFGKELFKMHVVWVGKRCRLPLNGHSREWKFFLGKQLAIYSKIWDLSPLVKLLFLVSSFLCVYDVDYQNSPEKKIARLYYFAEGNGQNSPGTLLKMVLWLLIRFFFFPYEEMLWKHTLIYWDGSLELLNMQFILPFFLTLVTECSMTVSS